MPGRAHWHGDQNVILTNIRLPTQAQIEVHGVLGVWTEI